MPRIGTWTMDDNELSIKKASEEAFDAQTSSKSRSIQRRKSDLSSSSSSSAASSVANKEAIARLRANMQKIPATFGSNDQEVRVTRSKLRSIIEHKDGGCDSDSRASSVADEALETKPVRRVTRRVSKKLAQVKEEELNSPVMSISNLKKHNAAFEKLDAIADLIKKEDEEVDEMANIRINGGRKPAAVRVTRSMVSVSPNASSCVSESTMVSIASTSAVKSPKKVGRKYVFLIRT